jgi:hypothetical protein
MRRVLHGSLAVVLALVAVVAATPPPARAMQAQWVIDENARPGTATWRIPPGSPHDIQGYADEVSAAVGERVGLYVDTSAPRFRVRAFRLGYYQGLGGRLIWTSRRHDGVRQPPSTVDLDTLMVSTTWTRSLRFRVTDAWVQGSYLLKLVSSTGGQSYIPFVVRDDMSTAPLVIQQQVFTWQAYNDWGGRSLYHGPGGFDDRSRVVSFDRPYTGDGSAGMLRSLPLIALVEQAGMDITYRTDRDLHVRPTELQQHQTLVTLNHDEYWSTAMRDAVESARAVGVNLVSLGANGIYRHVRVQASPLGPAREIVCYKIRDEDPLNGVNNAEVTVNWRSPPVNDPESAVLGAMYDCFGVDHADMVVGDAGAWVFAGTGLHDGDHIAGAVDGEVDRVFPGEPTPASIQVLAHSPATCDDKRSVSDMTYYTASSGAGVVDVGSLGWYKALRCAPPVATPSCSPAATRITRNVLSAGWAPFGDAHPSVPNAAAFGYTLTDPTYP